MQDNRLKKIIVVLGIWFIYFSFGFSIASLSPLVHFITNDLMISYKKMGIILGTWQFVYILFAIPAGYILDKFSFKYNLLIACIILSLSIISRSFAQSFIQFLLAVAIFGIGGSLISVGIPKVTSINFYGKTRAIVMGILMTAPPAGAIICLSITSLVFLPVFENDWRNILYIYALLPLLAGAIWIILNHIFQLNFEAQNHVITFNQQINLLKVFLLNKRIILTLILAIIAFYLNHGLASWLPKILVSKGMSITLAPLYAAIPVFIGIFSALIIPRIAIKKARFNILILLMANAAFSVILLQNDLGIFLLIGLMLLGITWGSLIAILLTHLTDTNIVNSKQSGLAGGLFFTLAELGAILGPFSIGLIYDITNNFNSALAFYSIILFVMIIPILVLKRIN